MAAKHYVIVTANLQQPTLYKNYSSINCKLKIKDQAS